MVDTVVSSLGVAHMTPMDQEAFLSLEEQNRKLRLLNRAGHILTSTHDMEALLARFLQIAAQLLEAEGGSVWLWDKEDDQLLVCRSAFHSGVAVDLVGGTVAIGQGLVGWVAEMGESDIVVETAGDNRFNQSFDIKNNFTTNSLLAVPLRLQGQVIGVLEVVNKIEGIFGAEDVTIAETLASSAAIAIDNARLVAQLQQNVIDLEQRNAELDAFDHTVAHDLQNPLSLVQGFADLLYYEADSVSDDQRQTALRQLIIHTQRMSNIVEELLMLSSVRKSDVVHLPLSMGDVVESALLRLKLMQDKYQPQIIMPESWPIVMGHALWIEEIWENYIGNAMKYGGRPPVIELGYTRLANGRIQFWVQDNGEGIAPDKLEMLFIPFTRLNEVRVTGHGLGLSIVSRIMEKLGGQAWATSEVGKGSKFSFTLDAYSSVQ